MGGGSSKPQAQRRFSDLPILEVPLKHLFGPKRGETSILKFRALKAPETTSDAEYRIHSALQKDGFEPTESMVQKIVDRLVTFTRKNGYQVPGNQPRRRPTVAQTLVGSAARAIFIQYDIDKSGNIDAAELSAMMTNVRQAQAAAKGDVFEPTEEDRTMSLTGAEKIINILDADGNGNLDEDEFVDAIVRSFGWSVEMRVENISKLSKGNDEIIFLMDNFFNGVRFCVGHILQNTSAAVIEKCMNPPENMNKAEAQLLAAERVASSTEE
tara:strand:+ start:267 stop:1073 length:807 start_codon:yes stop_codon:yes gene_type:complete